MKRILAVSFAILLCLSVCTAHAEFSRENYYDMGLRILKEMDPDQLEDAIDYFNAAGNYQEAKNYRQYVMSLRDIFAIGNDEPVDLETTAYRLQILAEKPRFEASLTEFDLPSCSNLETYIIARQLEESGAYAEAWHIYAEIDNVLDSLDRRIELTPFSYEQGKEALAKKKYQDAADALQGLKWRDSDTLYQQAMTALSIPTSADITVTYKTDTGIILGTETITVLTGCGKTIMAKNFDGYDLCGSSIETIIVDLQGKANINSVTFTYTEEEEDDWEAPTMPPEMAYLLLQSSYDMPDLVKVGEYITFGHYPQTASGTDNTPIEWLVLDVDAANHQALIISRYGLDSQPYNTKDEKTTWETSSLHRWLNNEFLNAAFSIEEQKYIISSDSVKITLLSAAEAEQYFSIESKSGFFSPCIASRLSPTAYAIAQDADSYTLRGIFYQTSDGKESWPWWLRSADAASMAVLARSGSTQSNGSAVDLVNDNGAIVECPVDYKNLIRPALWIDLNAGTF